MIPRLTVPQRLMFSAAYGRPGISTPEAAEWTGLNIATAHRAAHRLERLRLLTSDLITLPGHECAAPPRALRVYRPHPETLC